MADREKAINELQWFLTARPVVSSEERYDQFCEGLRNALELLEEQQHQIWEMQELNEYLNDLLKEQEAVKPKVIRMNEFGHPVHACGKCGCLITESMNYCSWCGRSVKWDG